MLTLVVFLKLVCWEYFYTSKHTLAVFRLKVFVLYYVFIFNSNDLVDNIYLWYVVC